MESAREERVPLAPHFSVARGTTSVVVIRGVSFTFAKWEAHLENAPRGRSSFQDPGLGGCSSFAQWQTQAGCFHDSARPRPTQGRCGPQGPFGRTEGQQGKRPFRVEPRYSKIQTKCRDSHGRELPLSLERKRSLIGACFCIAYGFVSGMLASVSDFTDTALGASFAKLFPCRVR